MPTRHAVRNFVEASHVAAFVLLFSLLLPAFAQDDPLKGVQYTRDSKDRLVGLNYWGTSGLRRVVTEDVSQLETVYIAYGTKLSADDMSVLSSLENVRNLTLGGVMSAESVYIEGSLDKLTGMKKLRSLSLCKDRLQDDDLAFIAKFS